MPFFDNLLFGGKWCNLQQQVWSAKHNDVCGFQFDGACMAHQIMHDGQLLGIHAAGSTRPVVIVPGMYHQVSTTMGVDIIDGVLGCMAFRTVSWSGQD